MGLFSLEKRRLQGHLLEAFQYLKRACKKDGEEHFTRACSDRTRNYGFKLKKGIFRLAVSFGFGCRRQQKCHAAAPPPTAVRRRMEGKQAEKRWVGDKGSLTEQQTEGTVTTTIQIRRKHDKTDRRTEPRSRTAPLLHTPEL